MPERMDKGDNANCLKTEEIMNRYEYSVVPENIDFKGQITVPSLCGHIVNAIGQNIRKEGYGIDVMARENRSWILLRSAFEIDVRPGLYSPIYVTVWPGPGNGITYHRCIRITDSRDRELGRGTTEWCIIDRTTRRPVFPDLELVNVEDDIPCRSPRRIRDFDPDVRDDRKVCYSDCDFNGHLNNTRYVELLYDMLPEDVLDRPSPIRLDINYRHEVRLGEKVSLGLKRETPDECLFIARAGNQTLCSASLMSA